MKPLRLRPLTAADEQAVLAAHETLAEDDFVFALGYDPSRPFHELVTYHENLARGIEVPDGRVPATFLLAVVGADIVGRVSIRHTLNDFLAAEGGHIGYAVLPGFRGQGYATEVLRQACTIAASLGISSALLVCEERNLASITVIERCNGALRDHVVSAQGVPLRRYDIDLFVRPEDAVSSLP